MIPVVRPEPRRNRQRSNSCSSTAATPNPEAVLSRFIQNVHWQAPQAPPSPALSTIACPPTPLPEEERPMPRMVVKKEASWERLSYSYGAKKYIPPSTLKRTTFLAEYEDSDAAKESAREDVIGHIIGTWDETVRKIKGTHKKRAVTQPSKLREVQTREQASPDLQQSNIGTLVDSISNLQLSASPSSSRPPSIRSRESPTQHLRSSSDESSQSRRSIERRGSLSHSVYSGKPKPRRSKSLKEHSKPVRGGSAPMPPSARHPREFLVSPNRTSPLPTPYNVEGALIDLAEEFPLPNHGEPQRHAPPMYHNYGDARDFWPQHTASARPVPHMRHFSSPEIQYARYVDHVRERAHIPRDDPDAAGSSTMVEPDSDSHTLIDLAAPADESLDMDEIIEFYKDEASPHSPDDTESLVTKYDGAGTCFRCHQEVKDNFVDHLMKHAEEEEQEQEGQRLRADV